MTRTIPRTSFINSTLSLLPTALLVLAAAGLAGCDASADATPPPAPEVTVRAAVEQQIDDWETYTGRFEAAQRVEPRPRVDGYNDRVAFSKGSMVKTGELLFQNEPSTSTARLKTAQAEHPPAR